MADRYKFPPQLFSGKPQIVDLGSSAFTIGGARIRFPLEKRGYGDMLIARVSGQYDVSTAALVLLPRAPWNLVSFLLAPPGRQKLLDVGGWSVRLNNLTQRDFSPFGITARDVRTDGLDANTGRSASLNTFPTATGNDQTFDLWYVIPFHRSATDPRGRLPLGNPTETVLYVQPRATEADLVTTAANWAQDSLTCQVWQVSYDAPPPSADGEIAPFDTSWVVTLEVFEDVAAVGDNVIEIDPGGVILDVYHTVALNDVLTTSDDISEIAFRVDNTDIVDATDPRVWYYAQKHAAGFSLPDGVIWYGFDTYADSDGGAAFLDGAGYEPSIGRWLHTDQANSIKSTITIPSGTTLGSTPRIHTTVRRLERVRG